MIRLITRLIETIRRGVNTMSQSTDNLTAAVAANTTAINALIAKLPSPADTAAVDAATTQLTANNAALVAATPA